MGIWSLIEWCHHTFNIWWGCQRVSPGCELCYAEKWDHRVGGGHWGPTSPRRFMSDDYWRRPLKWDRAAAAAGERHRVFCSSMADVFEVHRDPAVNARMDQERLRLWRLIEATPHLDWLLLTKRPERFAILPWLTSDGWRKPWRNVWIGVTVEDQRRADERLPLLMFAPAWIRFVSYEPALEQVDFRKAWTTKRYTGLPAYPNWLIAGAESGPGARPAHPDWIRSARDQCQEDRVSFFFKQWVGAWEGTGIEPTHEVTKRTRKLSVPLLDGRQHVEFPCS